MQFAEFFGIHPTFTDSTMTGGSVFEVYLEHAASAVAAGVAECVLVVFAQTPRAGRTARQATRHGPERRADGRAQPCTDPTIR